MSRITDLPNHLVALIVQHLTIEERCRCCIINKAFNSLSSQQQLGPVLRVRPKQVSFQTLRGCLHYRCLPPEPHDKSLMRDPLP